MTSRIVYLEPDKIRKTNIMPTKEEKDSFLGASHHVDLHKGQDTGNTGFDSTKFNEEYPRLASFLAEANSRFSVLYSRGWSSRRSGEPNPVASSIYYRDRPNFMNGNVILIAESQ